MRITRRNTLKGLVAGLVAGTQPVLFSHAGEIKTSTGSTPALFLTTRKNHDGTYSTVIFSADGHDILELALPDRGHAAAYHAATGACVTFARRPGKFALAFNKNRKSDGYETQLILPEANRHFYGHGLFSADGRLLYATENNYADATGIISVRDVAGRYRHIGEFSSYGTGPHELCLLPDNKTLVVANGGIATHPDSGRTKLNLATMAPNISYIDSQTGELLEQYQLPKTLHQLSIRHMSVVGADVLAFGCQYQGPALDQPALIGFHKRGHALEIHAAPASIQPQLKNYIGSIATSHDSNVVAASAPRGGLITYWDASSCSYIGQTRLRDGCGIAPIPAPKQFMLTSGSGIIGIGGPETPFHSPDNRPDKIHWDNHVRLL